MSDTAKSAQATYVGIEDPAAPGVFVDVSTKATNARMPFTRGDLDTSGFGQGDMTSVSGMRDSTFTLDVFGDKDLNGLMYRIYMSPNPVNARYGPEGPATGNERYTAKFNMTGWEPGGSANGLNTASVNFHRTGGTVRDLFT